MNRSCPVCGKGFTKKDNLRKHNSGGKQCLAAAARKPGTIRHGPPAWASARSFVAIDGERLVDWIGVDEKGGAWLAFKP